MQNDPSSSTLRQSLLRSRIAKLPHLPAIAPGQSKATSAGANTSSGFAAPPIGEVTEDEEGQDVLPSLNAKKSSNRSRRHGAHDSDAFDAMTADDCFAEALEVEVDEENEDGSSSKTTFRVYYTSPSQAKLRRSGVGSTNVPTNIDGRGASLLAAPLVDEEEEDDEQRGPASAGTIFMLHHGAGYSALSFALVAKHISEATQGKVGVLAYDCRGHGRTVHSSETDGNKMSLTTLTKDGLSILAKLYPPNTPQPNLILVGHSMGGAVVVSIAHALQDMESQQNRPNVAGVAVLDVVEGTAIDALPIMRTIVSQLPRGFPTVADAVRWHVDSGTIVNLNSARRSVPSLLRRNVAYEEDVAQDAQESHVSEQEPMEMMKDTTPATDTPSAFPFVWRHDLLATEPHWRGWFEGLSASFLSVKCARLLLLAGTDRLDKELMIGQMQGKYQLVVFQDVGHSLQEDAPQRTAETLIEFWRRNEALDINAIRGIRKVGQA